MVIEMLVGIGGVGEGEVVRVVIRKGVVNRKFIKS
jgi:hypothetical protein